MSESKVTDGKNSLFLHRLIKKDGLQPSTLPELSIINRFENTSSLCQSHTFGKGGSHTFGSCICYLATTSSFSAPVWPGRAALNSTNAEDEGQVRASRWASGQHTFLPKVSEASSCDFTQQIAKYHTDVPPILHPSRMGERTGGRKIKLFGWDKDSLIGQKWKGK